MSRRAFRLAAILRMRQAQEQQAAGELARANAALGRAENAALSAARSHAEHALTSGQGAAFLASVAARAALNAAAQDADMERQVAAREVDGAMDRWREAKRTTKSLEHLEAKHQRELREAEFKREQKILDDLANRNSAPRAQDRGSE